MSHSAKLNKHFGSLNIGNHSISDEPSGLVITGLVDDGGMTGPGTSTTNGLARFTDTTGAVLKDAPLTLSDAGVLSSSGSVTLSSTGSTVDVVSNGAMTLSSGGTCSLTADTVSLTSTAGDLDVTSSASLTLTSGGPITVSGSALLLPKAVTTQITDATTGVTVDSVAGQVVTVSLTTVAGATETFTVTNATVVGSSVIFCTPLYSGVIGTDGIPYVTINNVTSGSFQVNVTNIHPTTALNGTVKINFLVV